MSRRSWTPNVPRINRRRVKQRAKQELIRYKDEISNNEILDQAVGYMRLLARLALCSGKPQTP
jgi:hypothetical protein